MKPWEESKNKLNKRAHGISFETALLVFDDPFGVSAEDYIDENGEMRYQTIGSIDGMLIFVAHVFRVLEDGVETPWIINARKAVKNEEDIYWSNQRKS